MVFRAIRQRGASITPTWPRPWFYVGCPIDASDRMSPRPVHRAQSSPIVPIPFPGIFNQPTPNLLISRSLNLPISRIVKLTISRWLTVASIHGTIGQRLDEALADSARGPYPGSASVRQDNPGRRCCVLQQA